jgi:hypothetical protein
MLAHCIGEAAKREARARTTWRIARQQRRLREADDPHALVNLDAGDDALLLQDNNEGGGIGRLLVEGLLEENAAAVGVAGE